jgi:regulator of ribonuclease activity A
VFLGGENNTSPGNAQKRVFKGWQHHGQDIFFSTKFSGSFAMPEMPHIPTCDLCDAHKSDESGAFRVLPPVFRDYGARKRFAGEVATVKCYEDNSLVKAAVDSEGRGRVLVVDGGASLRRALLGGNLGAAAARNGWAGVVIDGCVRDVAELADCTVGIRALASMPWPTEKRGEGQTDVAVVIQGVWVRPGDWLYADEDGIVVSAKPLHGQDAG